MDVWKDGERTIWKLADVPTFFSVILLRRQRHRWPPTVATADAFQPDKLPELLSEELHRPYRHLGTWMAHLDSLKPCSLREMVASEKRSSDFDFGKNRQRFQCVLYTVHDVSYSQLCISFQIASVTCRRGAAAVVERSTQPICRQRARCNDVIPFDRSLNMWHFSFLICWRDGSECAVQSTCHRLWSRNCAARLTGSLFQNRRAMWQAKGR